VYCWIILFYDFIKLHKEKLITFTLCSDNKRKSQKIYSIRRGLFYKRLGLSFFAFGVEGEESFLAVSLKKLNMG